MDKELSVASQNRKARRQAKSKKSKKPLKVVYISNPVWFQASAAEFRDLVQRVTGRDSDIDNLPESAFNGGETDSRTGVGKLEQGGERQFGLFEGEFDVQAMMENWSGPGEMFYEAPRPPQIGAAHGADKV